MHTVASVNPKDGQISLLAAGVQHHEIATEINFATFVPQACLRQIMFKMCPSIKMSAFAFYASPVEKPRKAPSQALFWALLGAD